MAIVIEENSLDYLAGFSPIRCDTHFRHNIQQADTFFSLPGITWFALDSVLEEVRNGMNLKTDYYSMEKTNVFYLSVSQIKEYGLIEKNQNYLKDEVKDLKNYIELEPDMLLITRSGTVGVALSTNHPSFNFDENCYVASGFVITAKVKGGLSANIIAGYINLVDVQKYLMAMAAGACQKNISQTVLKKLPVPICLLNGAVEIEQSFKEYEQESRDILKSMDLLEKQLTELKSNVSDSVKSEIINC